MAAYIKRDAIIGLAHKLRFGRILTDREVEVVEMVVNSVSDDVVVDLVRCQECKHADEYSFCDYFGCDDFCSHGERKGAGK